MPSPAPRRAHPSNPANPANPAHPATASHEDSARPEPHAPARAPEAPARRPNAPARAPKGPARGLTAGRGCAAAALLSFAVLALAFSLVATIEAESPQEFPGLRDNNSDVALVALLLAVIVVLVALAAIRYARPRTLIPLATLCALLLALATYRAYTLAPMLECEGHNAVAQEPDGSYTCLDR